MLRGASSLYVKRTGLSGCSADKACANKDVELITAAAPATAEQISTTARNPVNNTARSSNSHKPLTDNQVALSAQRGGSLTLSSPHHSLFPSLHFILLLSATRLLVLINETKSAEMHQKGYCSQSNSEISLTHNPPSLDAHSMRTHTNTEDCSGQCSERK